MEREPGQDQGIGSPTDVTVREFMTEEVVTTTADAPVDEVARELHRRGISGMPVVNADGALIGVVSEYDVISKRGRTVGQIMSGGVITVGDDAGAAEVAAIMGLHGIRRVPVLRAGRLVGIVSRSDMIRLFSQVRWTCTNCDAFERGFRRPERCEQCGATVFRLEREPEIG